MPTSPSARAPIPPEALRTASGLDLMRGMLDGSHPRAPIGDLMDMSAGACGEGWFEFVALPGAKHYNPIGTVHGGFAATLLDSCMGCAVHTSLAAGIGYTTIDLNITYLKAITVQTGEVRARGEVIASGRRVATARGTLVDSEGRLLATGTTTCLVFPLGEMARR